MAMLIFFQLNGLLKLLSGPQVQSFTLIDLSSLKLYIKFRNKAEM